MPSGASYEILSSVAFMLQCENEPKQRQNCLTEFVDKFLVTDNESK